VGAGSKGNSMEWLKSRFGDPDLISLSFQFSFLVMGTLFVIILLIAACNQIPGEVRTTEKVQFLSGILKQ